MSLNFRHIKGTTFEAVKFAIDISETPIDLSEATIVMNLRKQNGGDVVLSLTSLNNKGITITDAINGCFEIDEQVIDIPVFNYIYEIGFDFDGKIKKYISGYFLEEYNNPNKQC